MSSARNKLKDIPNLKIDDNQETETYDTYDFLKGLWISKISVDIQGKLIRNSNHFFDSVLNNIDIKGGQETGIFGNNLPPRTPHFIYSRIYKNYTELTKQNKTDKEINIIEDKCIYLHNSFSSGNAGHDLCCILNTLSKYMNDINIKFILFDEIDTDCFISNIIKTLITDDKIIKIKENTIYNFKKQIFNFELGVHKISDYQSIINVLLYKLQSGKHENLKLEYENLKNRNVILIKNTSNKFVVRKDDCFIADKLFYYLQSIGWIVLSSDTYDFYKMTYILMNAKTIITGQQGISCCNQIFYNPSAKIIGFIVNCKNKLEYVVNKNHIKRDIMCNDLYYDRMSNVILSPLDINEDAVNEFKKINI